MLSRAEEDKNLWYRALSARALSARTVASASARFPAASAEVAPRGVVEAVEMPVTLPPTRSLAEAYTYTASVQPEGFRFQEQQQQGQQNTPHVHLELPTAPVLQGPCVYSVPLVLSSVLHSGAVPLPRFYRAQPAEPAEQQYASRARPYGSENLQNAQGLPVALEAHGLERRPARPPMTQSLETARVRQRQQRVRQQQHIKEGAWEWGLAVPCKQPCLPALLPFPWPVHS